MVKSRNLSDVVNAEISAHRAETEKLLGVVVDRIYSSGDFGKIDLFRGVIQGFCARGDEAVRDRSVVKITRGRKVIPYKMAREMWKNYDKEQGNDVVTDSAYRLRVITAADGGNLAVKKKGNRIVGVYEKGLKKLMRRYQGRQQPEGDFNKLVRLTREGADADEALDVIGIIGKQRGGYKAALSRYYS
jgi:hypothetical protein